MGGGQNILPVCLLFVPSTCMGGGQNILPVCLLFVPSTCMGGGQNILPELVLRAAAHFLKRNSGSRYRVRSKRGRSCRGINFHIAILDGIFLAMRFLKTL